MKWRDRLEVALREKRAGVQAGPVVSQDSQNNGDTELKDVSSILEVPIFSVYLLFYHQWKAMHHTNAFELVVLKYKFFFSGGSFEVHNPQNCLIFFRIQSLQLNHLLGQRDQGWSTMLN